MPDSTLRKALPQAPGTPETLSATRGKVSGLPETLPSTQNNLSGEPETLPRSEFTLSGLPETLFSSCGGLSGSPDEFQRLQFLRNITPLRSSVKLSTYKVNLYTLFLLSLSTFTFEKTHKPLNF